MMVGGPGPAKTPCIQKGFASWWYLYVLLTALHSSMLLAFIASFRPGVDSNEYSFCASFFFFFSLKSLFICCPCPTVQKARRL